MSLQFWKTNNKDDDDAKANSAAQNAENQNAKTAEKAHAEGRKAEEKAAQLLKKTGYEIIARNYRSRFGEIDIVAKQKDTLVFTEVKARNNSAEFGGAAVAVTKAKQQKLIKTAFLYMQEKGFEKMNMRFDIIAFDGDNCNHIINAFS